MRIAQVNLGLLPIPPNSWGAVEKIIWEYKCELEKLGHIVDIPYINEIESGVYDIVHVHAWNHALEMYKKGIPYIYTCHDHHVYLAGKETQLYTDNLLAMKLAEVAIVPAPFLIEYFDGFPIYLEHGVSLNNYTIKKEINEHKIICVGNNGVISNPTFDRKGFRYAIEAATKLNLPITVIGPTNNNKQFFDKNRNLLRPNVDIKYDLTDDELVDNYSNHTILVHATSIEAGHPPLTILEAASSGLPVITTDCSGDLHTTQIERDVDDIVSKIQYVMENYESEKLKTLDSVQNFDWKNVVSKLDKIYETVSKTDMKNVAIRIYENTKRLNYENILDINFIDGPKVKITGQFPEQYNVKFIDKSKGEVVYSADISTNSWAKANKKKFVDWKIVITDSKNNVIEHNFDLNNKKVLIYIDSNSIGDTIAWFPYLDEFRKKHNCKLVASTFMNDFFATEYPEIEFIKPGDTADNLYAMYCIGLFYNEDDSINLFKNPIDPKTVTLQKMCSDILGLSFKEIKPKLQRKNPSLEKINQVCIGVFGTAQSKFWNNPTGWQDVVNWLNNKGYTVKLISKEGDDYMGNKLPYGIVKHPDGPIELVMDELKKSKAFIGIGSGLSWLSWSLDVPTVLISGFSYDWAEMEDCIRITAPKGKCEGCFNRVRLDPSDWNWCPDHKGTDRQFECTKSITSEMVIKELEKFL